MIQIKDLVKRYKTDESFRNKVNLYGGAITNLVFVGIQLYGGIKYRSAWFTALAVYYAVLSAVKFYIGCSVDKKGKEAWKTLWVAGCVMTILNLALITMISIMIANPSIALHGYSMTIAAIIAIWTLASAGMAVYTTIKARRTNNPIILADRLVQLIVAVVSVLMLQTAMVASTNASIIEEARETIESFGSIANIPAGVSELFTETFSRLVTSNRVTGIIVAFIVGGITVYMIAKGVVEEKKLRHSTNKASLNSGKHN